MKDGIAPPEQRVPGDLKLSRGSKKGPRDGRDWLHLSHWYRGESQEVQ